MAQFDKPYEFAEVESKWYSYWEKKGFFTPDLKSDRPVFSIVIPPPNVTGVLHMGHALTMTIEDLIVRWKRMEGFNTLWLPGTDHAGIATQNVVERELGKQGINRHQLGREKFLKKVWEWKEQSEKVILQQIRRLGSSCDWTRQRFTLDEGLSRAVREVFVRLYEEGLIYRDKYLINSCPRCHTALSDLEVEHKEVSGTLWHIRYPLVDGKGSIIVATTRPETLLGDVAVAVHPEDERYSKLIGKKVILPCLKREIPIIADEYVDRTFGSGAVKITPAHDFNDFQVGQRHKLTLISVMDMEGKMNENAGPYKGLDRLACRKRILSDLKEEGLLEKEEPYKVAVGVCDRCNTPVEPNLSTQWFVKIEPLATPAIKAVEEGTITIIPESWTKTYYSWMYNIKDWCISRQLWWGHQIPAWYCQDCGKISVSRDNLKTCQHCQSFHIEQDSDVLDTWFSSALWPFSTLGWPDKTSDLKLFYPTSVMETGFDILFFWVARMIMMGLKFMGDVPFRHVYLHAMVRDEKGEKMTKSKGNVIDPLELIGEYGADALRFSLAVQASHGRDVKISSERVNGYRLFINKIWNVTRFVLLKIEGSSHKEPDLSQLSIYDRWILTQLQRAIRETRAALEEYRFNEASQTLYHFVWYEFCDWYVELSKISLEESSDERQRAATHYVLLHVLENIIRLLHPFIPFVTEEIWQALPEKKSESVMRAPYPDIAPHYEFPQTVSEISALQEIITALRNIRGENRISPAKKLQAYFLPFEGQETQWLWQHQAALLSLARLEKVELITTKMSGYCATVAVAGFQIFIPLEGVVDKEEERKRLMKELEKIEEDLLMIDNKLSNKNFTAKAPREVVEEHEKRRVDLDLKKGKLQEALKKLIS